MCSRSVVTVLLIGLLNFCSTSYINPQTFLDARLTKGSWISSRDLYSDDQLFEGGWVWTESGNILVTHICRAKIHGLPSISVEPGELLNSTCYISTPPTLENIGGVREFTDYEVLLKIGNEVYEWEDFDSTSGDVPNGAVIGGIGANYEPVLICRKFFNGTVGGEGRKSKAVLGRFVPKDGKCYYELAFGSTLCKNSESSYRFQN